MTKLLEQVVSATRPLPPEQWDDIARLVLHLAGDVGAPIALTSEERAALNRSKAAAARGE